ncbi:winged helix DNA-binding protein [bacterium]|nr:winged helix DNA-binding protein [bacterium]
MKLDDILGFKLYKVTSLLKGQIFHQFFESGIDINFEQWIILNRLWDEDGLVQNDLLQKTMQTKGNLARTLKKMSEEGLINKKENEEDQRSARIFLTKKGQQLKTKLRPIALKRLAHATDGISASELKTVHRVLEQMAENLKRG